MAAPAIVLKSLELSINPWIGFYGDYYGLGSCSLVAVWHPY